MMRKVLCVLAVSLIAAPAWAGSGDGMSLLGVSQASYVAPGGSYTGPGDITTFTAWWGFRAYSAAKAAAGVNAANIRRASDSETCDFPVTSSGGLGNSKNCSGSDNGQSLSTFLNATTGAVTKMYDQTGNGWDIAQATAANQPSITISCINSQPCAQDTSGSTVTLVASSNFTPSSGIVSFATVAERATSSTNSTAFIRENGASGGNRLGPVGGSTNGWALTGAASGAVNVTASDAAAHSSTGVVNGASSVLAIDGAESTGSTTGSTTSGAPTWYSSSASAVTEYEAESGFTDNVAFSGTIRTNLCHNMRLYYGTSGSC